MEGGAVGHILKGTHPRTIPARFGLIRFRGFRGEDLNVKVYDVRRTDAKSSHGLLPGELKTISNLKEKLKLYMPSKYAKFRNLDPFGNKIANNV